MILGQPSRCWCCSVGSMRGEVHVACVFSGRGRSQSPHGEAIEDSFHPPPLHPNPSTSAIQPASRPHQERPIRLPAIQPASRVAKKLTSFSCSVHSLQ